MFFRYVLGSLAARKVSNLVAVLSIGLVIGASVLSFAFYNGLRANMAATGRPDNIVVVASGVLQTTKSMLAKEAIDRIEVLPGIGSENGELLVSPESHLEVEAEDGENTYPLRAVDPVAFRVHDQVKVIEGRPFDKGSNEVIIGKKLIGKSPSWKLGGSVRMGNEDFPIVGVFEAGASALEGELWADRQRAVIMLKREKILAAVVRAASPSEVQPLIEAIKGVKLSGSDVGAFALPEREYYETTLGNVDAVIAAVASVIVVLMMGAVFAAANTLHASLSSRMSEFAALWVVGHRRGRLVRLVLQEALLLCLAAAVVACVLASLFGGSEVSALLGGDLEFKLPFTIREIGAAFALALAICFLGTLYPGIQVLRRDLADDLG